MDCSSFEKSPVGDLVPIQGHDHFLKRDYAHFAFVPRPLPRELDLSMKTVKAVAEAERAIGRLDSAADKLPNPALLVRPALYREAVSTSALEGTYAPLHAVLEADYIEEQKITTEVREIRNYYTAAMRALKLIEEKPICLSVLAELQAILVFRTRGDGYDAGELRKRQVFIGERSGGVESARFVPPPDGDALIEGMSDWEKWVNAEDDIPLLVKVALAHYQFETLHPFSDGNGRLGRLTMVLQMIEAGALRYPILNMSPYLEPRKEQYKDLLLQTSMSGDFEPWIQFFAEGVIEQTGDAISRIDELLAIREGWVANLRHARAKGVVLQIVEDLIAYPLISISQAAELHGVTYPPAAAAIKRLESMGVLREVTGGSYGRLYACEAVMDVVERKHGLES